MRSKFWPRLIFLLVVIVLLAFVGARLFSMVLGLLESMATGGPTVRDPQFRYIDPTPTPRVYTEEEYLEMQGY